MPVDFSEFPPVSKAAWLAQVAKDLKDKPLESLYWQPEEALVVSPFVHADDFPAAARPLTQKPNAWEICEEVDAQDPEAANRQAIQALEFGAEALLFHLPETVGAAFLGQLLQGVYLDFVALHFDGAAVAKNPGAMLAALQQVATEQGVATTQLRGTLAYDPVSTSALVDWRYLADLLAFAAESFPGFRLLVLADQGLTAEPVEEMTQLLHRGNFYVQKLTERGLSAETVAKTLHFKLHIGKSYFLEIAKIRAFKILWLNVLKGWELPLDYPQLSAVFAPEAYGEDVYTNMVRATTMAMSACMGGVNTLSVRPYAAGRETEGGYPPAFGRRVARNVQHLLKMESGLDQVADPAAGSYYVENLTGQLGELAWKKFTRPI